MCDVTPDYEIRVSGRSLLKVSNGEVRVDGRNFHADLKSLTALVDILHDVIAAAEEVKKPRLVSEAPPRGPRFRPAVKKAIKIAGI